MKRAYIHRATLILANTLPLTSLSGTLRTAANLGAQILGSVGWPSSHSAKSTSDYKAHYLKDELVSWHEWMLEDPADVSSSSKRHRTHGACIARKLNYAVQYGAAMPANFRWRDGRREDNVPKRMPPRSTKRPYQQEIQDLSHCSYSKGHASLATAKWCEKLNTASADDISLVCR